jgi:hypothetical protein
VCKCIFLHLHLHTGSVKNIEMHLHDSVSIFKVVQVSSKKIRVLGAGSVVCCL